VLSAGWLTDVDGMWPVIGVVGGRGGAGASTFACVLAAMAALGGRSVLVDLDPVAGGLDVLLGIEATAGARWSGLRLDGGRLDPDVLVSGLPQWSSVAVLSADVPPPPGAVAQVLDVAARAGPVVVDLGRWPSPGREAALRRCSLTVLICAADVRSVTGARAVRLGLGRVPAGLVVVRSGRDPAPAPRVAALVDVPLIGVVSAVRRRGDSPLDAAQLPRSLSRVARGVLDAVAPS
jgi:secretion/DNA translocation related CpaE-like protein